MGTECFYTQGLWSFNATHRPDAFCETVFGITPAQTEAAIAATNRHYGGVQPNGTRVLWVNGEVDPWHSLSVLSSPGAGQPALMVAGASHHSWTHPSAAGDLASVVAARAAIRSQVTAWLAE